MTTGWKLDAEDKARLIAAYPPLFSQIVADHVTLHATGDPEADHVPPATYGDVVGHATDGRGVEALIVAILGTTERPAGGHYHITWSLSEGRTAKESNDVIAHSGWSPIAGGQITLHPAQW